MPLAIPLSHRRLGCMTNSEDAWKALSQTNDLIKGADTKAGAVLAASGVLGGILVRAVPAPRLWGHDPLHAGLLLFSMVLVAVSILLALRVVVPRLRTGKSRSLLYFDNIARQYADAADFALACRSLFEQGDRLHHALAEQLWATSCIARRKFRAVAPAIWLFGLALVAALVAGVLAD